MFEDFFYLLRDVGIPVSFTEWMTLQDALDKNLDNQSLLAFYYMARSILVKDIKYYDQYDQAFAFYFKDKTLPDKVRQQLLDWLKNPANRRGLMQRFPDFFEASISTSCARISRNSCASKRNVMMVETVGSGQAGNHHSAIRVSIQQAFALVDLVAATWHSRSRWIANSRIIDTISCSTRARSRLHSRNFEISGDLALMTSLIWTRPSTRRARIAGTLTSCFARPRKIKLRSRCSWMQADPWSLLLIL